MANEKPNKELIAWQNDRDKGLCHSGVVLGGMTATEQFNISYTEQRIIKLLTESKVNSYMLYSAIDSLKHSLKGFDVGYINNLFKENLGRDMTLRESQRFFRLLRTFNHGWQLYPHYDGGMVALPKTKAVYFAEVL